MMTAILIFPPSYFVYRKLFEEMVYLRKLFQSKKCCKLRSNVMNVIYDLKKKNSASLRLDYGYNKHFLKEENVYWGDVH